jgi:hypothetical protein
MDGQAVGGVCSSSLLLYIKESHMRIGSLADDFQAIWQAQVGDRPGWHRHFWERALSRRQLLGRSAGLAGVALGSALTLPAIAKAPGNGEPRPIPGGTPGPFGLVHFYFPTVRPNPAAAPDTIENTRGDPALIADFNGFIGSGEWGGGTGTDQTGTLLYWAADLRFMDGEYIALDGQHRQGAFAFL